MATTQQRLGQGAIPSQFYDMQTRLMILIAIIGLVVVWFGGQQMDRMIALIGLVLVLVGFIGAYLSFRNKRGMGFLRRL